MPCFESLLDAAAGILNSERRGTMGFPDDELHNEILLPLLPALLTDKVIRGHWMKKVTGGIYAKLKEPGSADEPLWEGSDFEIHVATSYLAGADARALADTLLSEEALREMAATILNSLTNTLMGERAEKSLVAPRLTSSGMDDIRPVAEIAFPAHIAKSRKALRSIIRSEAHGTFIVRRMLAGHWSAQRNRTDLK
jgi:hypothetical protein